MNEQLFLTPKLGFGFMRLPMNDGSIDMEQLNKMVDYFMENGFTYFDTAYVYHEGKSEIALREALVKRYKRESFTIADKLPAWVLHKDGDVEKVFNEQLERTGVSYFDYYLLHSIEEGHLPNYSKYNCWEFGKRMKAEGKIKNFGFSFHDKPELLDDLLSKHPEVDFVQLQINYIDWDNDLIQSGKCYEVARKHHKPIIIMEPVKGGRLANLSDEQNAILKAVNPDVSAASYALRFCQNLEGVMVVLSGMSTEEQLLDNVKTTKNLKPFTEEEKYALDLVKNSILGVPTIGCTGCSYCTEGCPMQLRIPDMFRAYNSILTYGEHGRPHFFYGGITGDGHKANTCIECGQCEGVCPQHLPISQLMKKISEVFD